MVCGESGSLGERRPALLLIFCPRLNLNKTPKQFVAMPNSVQKKLSNMFSRVSLTDKGNSATKVPVKGISKRLSSSPVASKENGVPVGAVMGGGDQEAMLTFIEQQGNQISQLKEHIASLEAKLLASPPGHVVKPAALLFSPIRGAHDLSEMKSPKSELKSPRKCISVSQASFVPHGSNSPLNVIVSPARNSHAFIPVTATTESPTMTAVQVMHYSQLSFDSTFSTANGSITAAKEAIPFQEFVDSCLSENVMSPTARPLLASYVGGDTSGIQEQGHTEEVSDTNALTAVEEVGLKIVSPPASALEQLKPIGEWKRQVVSFSSQTFWVHSVTAAIEIFEQIPLEAEFQVESVPVASNPKGNAVDRDTETVAIREESSSSRSPTVNHGGAATAAQHCQNDVAVNTEFEMRATEHVSGFEAASACQGNLLSPCAARMFHASPSLDAAAATHVQSKVSPGFSVVSPIINAACSNQASGNESGEFANHIVINGLVFSGMAKLPEQALRMLKHSRADFQLVNGVAWVPDCFADSCMLCEEEFSFFFRRHHCRSCGIVICSNCSEWNKEKRCCTSCMTASQTPSKQNRDSDQVYYA
jgi:hypothetical protein